MKARPGKVQKARGRHDGHSHGIGSQNGAASKHRKNVQDGGLAVDPEANRRSVVRSDTIKILPSSLSGRSDASAGKSRFVEGVDKHESPKHGWQPIVSEDPRDRIEHITKLSIETRPLLSQQSDIPGASREGETGSSPSIDHQDGLGWKPATRISRYEMEASVVFKKHFRLEAAVVINKDYRLQDEHLDPQSRPSSGEWNGVLYDNEPSREVQLRVFSTDGTETALQAGKPVVEQMDNAIAQNGELYHEELLEPSSHIQMIDDDTRADIEARGKLNEGKHEIAEDCGGNNGSRWEFGLQEEPEDPVAPIHKIPTRPISTNFKSKRTSGAGSRIKKYKSSGEIRGKATPNNSWQQQASSNKRSEAPSQIRRVAVDTPPAAGEFEGTVSSWETTLNGSVRKAEAIEVVEDVEPAPTGHMTHAPDPLPVDVFGDPESRPLHEARPVINVESNRIGQTTACPIAGAPVSKIQLCATRVADAHELSARSDLREDTGMAELEQLTRAFELWSATARGRWLRPDHVTMVLNVLGDRLLINQDLPTEGRLADMIWGCLLEFGSSSRERLNKVTTYAISLRKSTGKEWEILYYKTLLLHLQRNDDDVLSIHNVLYPIFQPTREQFVLLIESAYRLAPRAINQMPTIYEQLPFRDLYSPITQCLYQQEKFLAAAKWHNVFIACGDLPENPREYKPLLRWLLLYGTQKQLASTVQRMLDQRIPLPHFIDPPTPSNPVSRETVDQQLAVTDGRNTNSFGDGFYARLFATKLFSTDTVIGILRTLGTETIGPATLRELALKEGSDPRAVRARIEQLTEAGIALKNATFCTLVQKLCDEGNTRLLENVITCDLHPDTFGDEDLQESLLCTYYKSGQQLQFDRTIAVLLAKCPERHHPSYYWNLHLRLHLRLKDLPAVMRTLQTMQASHHSISIKSSHYVRIVFLTRRRVGIRPSTTKELFLIISIWQSVLRSGGTMPAHQWVEILRRLGMTGKLEDYEKLALWLAEWYSSSPARIFLGGVLKQPGTPAPRSIQHSIDVPKRVQTHHRNHPLHILFPAQAQQAIIAWGFQHARIGGPGWRWGLYMLLKLKQHNVYIERDTVSKACRLRLIALFGKRRSNRLINRAERDRNSKKMAYYVREMEKIGGKGIIGRTEYSRWRRFVGRSFPRRKASSVRGRADR